MQISEVLFYSTVLLYFLISIGITIYAEDLKDSRILIKYVIFTLGLGTFGIIMELSEWNFFCQYNYILSAFYPFITIILIKSITFVCFKIFKLEPFAIDELGLSNGVWKKNNGIIEYKLYYAIYSTIIIMLPILLIVKIFFYIDNHFCP